MQKLRTGTAKNKNKKVGEIAWLRYNASSWLISSTHLSILFILHNDYYLIGIENLLSFKKITKDFKHEVLLMQFGRRVIYYSYALFWDFLQWLSGKESISTQESQEMQVWSLSWENHLEEEMATHSRILARIIPWTEKPGGLQSLGLQRVGHNWVTEHTCTTLPPARSSHGNSEMWWKV